MRLLYLGLMIAGCAAPVMAAEKPGDAEITRLLVGEWTTNISGGAERKVDGTITYAGGGTFVAAGKVEITDGEPADVRVEGTWKVSGGAVVHAVTKSSHPGLAPVGVELKETVVSIDDKVLRIKRGVGKERERKRVGK